MAGIITHLVIAKEILKLLPPGTVKEEGLFYIGSFAPDAIHARPGYVREDKKHTHFRDNIHDRHFAFEENLSIFHSRVTDFIQKNKNREDGLLDLYRGYMVHILTDELYVLTIRQEFTELMKSQNIDQTDKEYYHRIVTDMSRNDFLLLDRYEAIDEIREKLEKAKTYPIEGLISKEELCKCKKWVIQHHFIEKNEVLEPVYISYERTLKFIHRAAENIVKRLSTGESFPKIF